jgi:hypothetical protein
MVDFTTDELLAIANWAMDKADEAKRCRLVNTYIYETTQAIFQKAHDEYFNRLKVEGL